MQSSTMEPPRNSNNDSTSYIDGGVCHGSNMANAAVSGGNRRRKKRPSYGVRTVEITKGENGFGFTISGQAPCMLSFIVPGSSAEKSGLRVGDYLIAVSGQNVSKVPHDKVVETIGNSNVVKLQIAENYYSDSSDDEFVTVNRQKPKFPNRLRHKQQQTRAERVVRDLQSGAIFSERAAIQLGEAAMLSDRDWPDTLNPPPLPPTTTSTAYHHYHHHHKAPTSPITTENPAASPTRRRLMPLPFPDTSAQNARQNPTPTHQFEEQIEQLARARLSPVKTVEKAGNNSNGGKNFPLGSIQHQYQQAHRIQQLVPKQQQSLQQHLKQQQQHQRIQPQLSNHLQHQHLRPLLQSPYHMHQHAQEGTTNGTAAAKHQLPTTLQSLQQQHHHHHHTHLDNTTLQQYQHQHLLKQYQQQHQLFQRHHHQEHQQQVLQQQQLIHQQLSSPQQASGLPALQVHGGAFSNEESNGHVISEQEINKILYPTLAELQLQGGPPPEIGESLYRAVVGYLGTIEVPKDSQGGSRLAAIKNCIRRLRIEKKVHTLVLMSVFTERVVLTNPHGVTLAQYPAERITFCGVYADDKKFFGLVTVHSLTNDEFSDASQDGRAVDRNNQGISSSCHVFMVDPSIVQHSDHARRAKSFRIECTPAGDDVPLTHCREFPESADPILHTIMSLYRSQPGFNFDNGGNGGLPDDVQMSPQHSNASSNSSNSDSGIGFRDDGGSHLYSRHERVFVVEVDDNKRMRIQNYHLVGNNRNNSVSNNNNNNNGAATSSANGASSSANTSNKNCGNLRTNSTSAANSNSHVDNLLNGDNLRSNGNFSMNITASGSNINGVQVDEDSGDNVPRTINSNTNPRTNNAVANTSKGNYRAISTGDRLRTNKCDPKSAKKLPPSDVSANSIGLNDEFIAKHSSVSGVNGDSSYMIRSAVESLAAEKEYYGSIGCSSQNMTDYLKAGLSDSANRRRRSESRGTITDLAPSASALIDGRSSITDELRAALLMSSRGEVKSSLAAAVDGRASVTEEKRSSSSGAGSRTPAPECSSPSNVERLTVRAMPDPVTVERSPLGEIPPHVNSMRYSMHKYLHNKQQQLVKVSQKINRRDSDTDGIHPLSVRAFSPANAKKKATTPTPSSSSTQNALDLELSLKLSPKVYGLPVACLTPSARNSAPSERSFSRSLEDLRDSSLSDGATGSIGAQRGSFRDGSESDQGMERFKQSQLPSSRMPMSRYLHASETNLSSYGAAMASASNSSAVTARSLALSGAGSAYGYSATPTAAEVYSYHRGAFRAVPPRAPPRPPPEVVETSNVATGSRLQSPVNSEMRPCGIASIDQIISSITRLGVSQTGTTDAPAPPPLPHPHHSLATPPSTSSIPPSSSFYGAGSHSSILKSSTSPSPLIHQHPAITDDDSLMGPPATTTVPKAIPQSSSSGALKTVSNYTNVMHSSNNVYHRSSSSPSYEVPTDMYSDEVAYTANAINANKPSTCNSNKFTNSNNSDTSAMCDNSKLYNSAAKRCSVLSVEESDECPPLTARDYLLPTEKYRDQETGDELPLQEEYMLESDFDNEADACVEKKNSSGSSSTSSSSSSSSTWARKHSLPKFQRPRLQQQQHNDNSGVGQRALQSDNEGSEVSSECGTGRVQSWSTSFEKLLEDPYGLHTFAEFLRKEYSHENIYFWTACERYRLAVDDSNSSSSNGAASPWDDWPGRHDAATEIYNKHLGPNAPEPVNVDSQARQVAKEGLPQPTQELFAAAQKQVFNLMKFDSYSRFLKSSMYQNYLERENGGEALHSILSGQELDSNLRICGPSSTGGISSSSSADSNSNFLKGGKGGNGGEMEERRRRSLLPWHRNKDRSKSKDRLATGSSDSKQPSRTGIAISNIKSASSSGLKMPKRAGVSSKAGVNGEVYESRVRSSSSSRITGHPMRRHPSDSSSSLGRASEVSGSRTSLNSGSEAGAPMLLPANKKTLSKESLTSSECLSLSGGECGGVTGRCRVVLPDRSQSVVAVRSGVTVDKVMRKLLDRRGLPFLAFNVLQSKGDKLISGTEDSVVLCNAEVKLQQLVLFRLDLPNQKTVCVKAKPHKTASDVLRPILAKYGFKLDLVHIHTMDDPRHINVKGPITELDGQKFIVQTKEDVKEWGVSVCSSAAPAAASGVSAATSREDTLDAITNRVFEDLLHSKASHQTLNSCDYDARSTKSDHNSEHSGKGQLKQSNSAPLSDKASCSVALKSGGAGGGVMTPSKDNDDLYEGLKRAQMSRIEDQRGTEINSELPDFLKRDDESKELLGIQDGRLLKYLAENDSSSYAACDTNSTAATPALPSAASNSSAYYNSGRGSCVPPPSSSSSSAHLHHHHHHHHYHLHQFPSQSSSTTNPPSSSAADAGVGSLSNLHSSHPSSASLTQHQHPPPPSSSAAAHHHGAPSSSTAQTSLSSLTQHQTHHNFWSDISGGGSSSIPSSLLATSSSSLSSSTGLPIASSTTAPFDCVVDTPLSLLSGLLDMQYGRGRQASSSNHGPKLRPRPESCVDPRTGLLPRPDQQNRPKSSCGALTAAGSRGGGLSSGSSNSSPDRTLLAPHDLDETLVASVSKDYVMRVTEDVVKMARLQSPTRLGNGGRTHHSHSALPHRLHRHPIHQLHSNVDCHSSSQHQSSATSNTQPLQSMKMPSSSSSSYHHPVSSPSISTAPSGPYSTPPPPLPPKPKLGIPPRGPPPRPPSRQLPIAPSCVAAAVSAAMEDTSVQRAQADPISFV